MTKLTQSQMRRLCVSENIAHAAAAAAVAAQDFSDEYQIIQIKDLEASLAS
jgi:hypothetical protein